MDLEQRLNQVAERYRAQGYQVVIRPGSDALPPFAKDFRVDLLAVRGDGNVLASVKASPSEMEADSNLQKYAAVIEKQPGWRYDLFVVGPDASPKPEIRDAKEPSHDEIRRALDEAERMFREGFTTQSLIAAWAALESAMRFRLRTHAAGKNWATSPRTMLNELFSSGVLSNRSFRELEGMMLMRNLIVHGFSAPPVDGNVIRTLVDTALRLLDESHAVKQPA